MYIYIYTHDYRCRHHHISSYIHARRSTQCFPESLLTSGESWSANERLGLCGRCREIAPRGWSTRRGCQRRCLQRSRLWWWKVNWTHNNYQQLINNRSTTNQWLINNLTLPVFHLDSRDLVAPKRSKNINKKPNNAQLFPAPAARTVQGVPLAVVTALANTSSGFCSCSTTPAWWSWYVLMASN